MIKLKVPAMIKLYLLIFKDSKNLIEAYKKYDKCCKITWLTNSWLSIIMWIYYYLIVPFIDLAVMAIINETNLIIRLFCAFIAFIIILNLFAVNYLLALIARNALNCYTYLNTLISRKSLSLRSKLKTLSMIERLSGPVIESIV